MKVVRPVISSNRVPYLQTRLIGSLSLSEREKEGIKEGRDLKLFTISSIPYYFRVLFRITSI